MDHARKMALVDPGLLDALRSQPPPPTDTVGKIVQTLDEEMKTILDRKDLDDGIKVTLYNQVLQRYNGLVDKRVKEPIRTISVNNSTKGSKTNEEEEEKEDTPIRRLEATVLDTVPKSLQAKARRLMEHLKKTSRGVNAANSCTRAFLLREVTRWISFTICCVRERPTLQRVGGRLRNNSAPSTYPWS